MRLQAYPAEDPQHAAGAELDRRAVSVSARSGQPRRHRPDRRLPVGALLSRLSRLRRSVARLRRRGAARPCRSSRGFRGSCQFGAAHRALRPRFPFSARCLPRGRSRGNSMSANFTWITRLTFSRDSRTARARRRADERGATRRGTSDSSPRRPRARCFRTRSSHRRTARRAEATRRRTRASGTSTRAT